MTDLKFTILEKLYFAEHRQMYKTPLFEECRKQYQLPEIYAALKDLDQDDLVDADLNSDVAKLTKNGRVIYESVKEERQYQEECKQRELNAEQRALKSEQLATESNALAAESNSLAVESNRISIESNRISIESNRLTKRSNIITVISIVVAILSIAVAIIQFFN